MGMLSGVGKKLASGPAGKVLGKLPGPIAKQLRKKKKKPVQAGLPPIAPGMEIEENLTVGMKHGGVVRASDKAKKNRAWSNRG